MLRKFLIFALPFAMSPAFSQICPVSNAVGIQDIGDGCSTHRAEYVFPSVGIFKSAFTPACNNHDKCYTQLGADYGSCDSKFYDELRAKCDSNYNKLLFPDTWAACRSTAYAYYTAVQQWGADANDQRIMQNDAHDRAVGLQNSVNSDVCGTNPQGTTIYAPGLISQVNSAFQSTAGRLPTIYEFLDAANQGDRLANPSGWYAGVVARAQVGATQAVPAVGWYMTQPGDYGVTFTATPIVTGATYYWRVSSLPNVTATSVSTSFSPPMFNRTVRFDGFVKATSGAGVRNMALVSASIVLPGTCAPNNGPNVNCQ